MLKRLLAKLYAAGWSLGQASGHFCGRLRNNTADLPNKLRLEEIGYGVIRNLTPGYLAYRLRWRIPRCEDIGKKSTIVYAPHQQVGIVLQLHKLEPAREKKEVLEKVNEVLKRHSAYDYVLSMDVPLCHHRPAVHSGPDFENNFAEDLWLSLSMHDLQNTEIHTNIEEMGITLVEAIDPDPLQL